MSDTHVTPANAEDAATLVEFNLRLAAETEGKTLDRGTVFRGVQAVLGDAGKGRYFVARDAHGAVVGQVMVTFEWSDWRDGAFWWLQSVYVHADHRGRGVFRALLAAVTDAAAAEGAVGLRLYVEDDNDAARAAYDRLGFTRPGYTVMERVVPKPSPDTRESPD